MREVLADGERRGRENPHAALRLDARRERRADVERRPVDRHRARREVEPAQPLARICRDDFVQARRARGCSARRSCASPRSTPPATRGSAPSPSSAAASSGSASRNAAGAAIHGVRPSARATATRECDERAAERAQGRRRRRPATPARPRLGEHVARQRLELARADGPTEELLRDVGKLMRFVDDHGVGARQQLAEPAVLQRKIREQQVMIDDDDIRGLRAAARLDDEAAIEESAFPAKTIVDRRRDLRA